MWGNAVTNGIDQAIRVVSWNITGNETSLWDVAYQIATWLS